ncbi:MAG: hypothetical protein U5K56_01335 [Halioglobus sp.]|nr:hypothetical protein [Halioglobus sp.]
MSGTCLFGEERTGPLAGVLPQLSLERGRDYLWMADTAQAPAPADTHGQCVRRRGPRYRGQGGHGRFRIRRRRHLRSRRFPGTGRGGPAALRTTGFYPPAPRRAAPTTETFKLRKSELREQAYHPGRVGDDIVYVRKPHSERYARLDRPFYEQLMRGSAGF